MKCIIACLFLILCIYLPDTKALSGAYKEMYSAHTSKRTEDFTPMEALDQVKVYYAANFEKSYYDTSDKEYYYKLPIADYYLAYEGLEANGNDYLIHLYEFVLDEPDTGIGHTVTYGWYKVDQESGAITDYLQ